MPTAPPSTSSGGIPAHPRCRCNISPVSERQAKKLQAAKGKQAKQTAAAGGLDDAAWTQIRNQRIQEYLRSNGKQSSGSKSARFNRLVETEMGS